MVDLIAYIREVNLGTEENPENKRVMFFRDTVGNRFRAKSRYKYIKPYCDLEYKDFVDAIYEAIDKEIEISGGEASNEANPYTQLDFDSLIDEAKVLWGKLIDENKTEDASKILEEVFGKPIKFSEIQPDEVKQLFRAITEIRDLL